MAWNLTSRVKKRWGGSPVWPALLSALVAPGVGQLVNREFAKGFFLLFASLGSFLWFSKVIGERLMALLPGSPETWATDPNVLRDAVTRVVKENPDAFVTFQILIVIVWTYGVVDAYVTARRLASSPPPSDESSHSLP